MPIAHVQVSDYWEKCGSNDGLVARTVRGELSAFRREQKIRITNQYLTMLQSQSTKHQLCKVDAVELSASKGVKLTGGALTGDTTSMIDDW